SVMGQRRLPGGCGLSDTEVLGLHGCTLSPRRLRRQDARRLQFRPTESDRPGSLERFPISMTEPRRRVLYVQFTNPAIYPPLEHVSSRMISGHAPSGMSCSRTVP